MGESMLQLLSQCENQRRVDPHVELVAQGTRAWADRNVENMDTFHHDLCGWCARASAELMIRLRRNASLRNIQIAFNPMHAFVIINGDTVVDVTATQFGSRYPQILIGSTSELQKLAAYWDPDDVFDCVAAARGYQQKLRWPIHQQITPDQVQQWNMLFDRLSN